MSSTYAIRCPDAPTARARQLAGRSLACSSGTRQLKNTTSSKETQHIYRWKLAVLGGERERNPAFETRKHSVMKRALAATATPYASSFRTPVSMATRSPPCSSALLRVIALVLAAFTVIPGNLAFVATTCGRPPLTLPRGTSIATRGSSMLLRGQRHQWYNGKAGATECNWGEKRREAATGLRMGADEVPEGGGSISGENRMNHAFHML